MSSPQDAIKIVDDFIAWSESEFARHLRPGTPEQVIFSLMRSLTTLLPQSMAYDKNLGTVYLASPPDQIQRGITLLRETAAQDEPRALTFDDIKGDMPKNFQLIDLDQFPYSKELAEGAILPPDQDAERKKAMAAHFRKVLPFEVSDDLMDREVGLHIANPSGGISYFHSKDKSNRVCVLTYSSKDVGEAGRAAFLQSPVERGLYEWDIDLPNTFNNYMMHARVAPTKIPDDRIVQFSDMLPELAYLIYASTTRYAFAKSAQAGSASALIHHFATTAIEDFLTGHAFFHGANSLYLTDDQRFTGIAGARFAIEAQKILQTRVDFRLNPNGIDDKKLDPRALDAAVMATLRRTQPQEDDRTPEGFTAGRLQYVKKEDAVKRLRAVRDLYYEGAFERRPAVALFARHVIAASLLVCPSAMMGDLKPHPNLAPVPNTKHER